MSGNALKIRPIDEPASLGQRIYDELKSAIRAMNIYDPDADLRLDERGLSQRFGASRTPLREALTRLDQEGLVKVLPRRGILIVRKPLRSHEKILKLLDAREELEDVQNVTSNSNIPEEVMAEVGEE